MEARKKTKKTSKAAARKTPKAAASETAKPKPKPSAAPAKTPKSPRGEAAIRAHPDAKLTKQQLKKLHGRLLEERDKLLLGIRRHVGQAVQDSSPLPEEGDVAQRATDQENALRLADKERKLLDQIAVALEKMDAGEYGICEGTEEPIGFRRLEIRPWARYSVEYKEMLDRQQR